MTTQRVLFVPGSGRVGSVAWPQQAEVAQAGWTFLGDEPPAVHLIGPAPIHVVAHSYGAIPAIAAAATAPALVRSLLLLEPACASAARGRSAVEDHVRRLSPVLARASDPSLSDADYVVSFMEALGAPSPVSSDPAAEARLRSLPAPWDVPLDLEPLRDIPTLVVTGGWSDFYEQIAEALVVAVGGAHLQLAGYGHRPQDHPGALAVMRSFWSEATG